MNFSITLNDTGNQLPPHTHVGDEYHGFKSH